MKEFFSKLVDFFQVEKEGDTPSTLGICLIPTEENEMIEIEVNDTLSVEFSDKFMYIDSDTYVGIVNIARIEQITEI